MKIWGLNKLIKNAYAATQNIIIFKILSVCCNK